MSFPGSWVLEVKDLKKAQEIFQGSCSCAWVPCFLNLLTGVDANGNDGSCRVGMGYGYEIH